MPELLLDIGQTGGGADFVIEGGDLKLDYGLRTMVLASLFSDARKEDGDEAPYGEQADPRGYWADTPSERFGSKLWLLDRAKLTTQTITDAQRWAEEALRWLVDEGIARAVSVVTSIGGPSRLNLDVTIERGSAARWQALWDAEAEVFVQGQVRVRLLTR